MGAEMRVHDPYVQHWWELETQDTYPAPGHSWSRFFRNQDRLKDIRMHQDLEVALKGADAVVLGPDQAAAIHQAVVQMYRAPERVGVLLAAIEQGYSTDEAARQAGHAEVVRLLEA